MYSHAGFAPARRVQKLCDSTNYFELLVTGKQLQSCSYYSCCMDNMRDTTKANHYGTTKIYKWINFCRSFLWEAALWERKKKQKWTEKNCSSVFFLWPPVISVGGQRKNTDSRNCSRHSKHCTKPAFEDEMCPRRSK